MAPSARLAVAQLSGSQQRQGGHLACSPFTGDDVAAACPRFTEARKPDAHALADIEAAFYKLLGGQYFDLSFLSLVAHLVWGTLTHKLLPWFVPPPAIMQLGAGRPYSEIQRSVKRDAAIVAALLLAALLFGLAKLFRVL